MENLVLAWVAIQPASSDQTVVTEPPPAPAHYAPKVQKKGAKRQRGKRGKRGQRRFNHQQRPKQ
jgi:hypothetical protein